MKKLILILVIAFTANFANAQKVKASHIPTPVLAKFSSLFPKSKAEQWNKDEENYATNFTFERNRKCIVIDTSGNIVRIKTFIKVSGLPSLATDYVKRNYLGAKITTAFVTTEADGTIIYEAEVKQKRLYFDSDGGFLKADKHK